MNIKSSQTLVEEAQKSIESLNSSEVKSSGINYWGVGNGS